VALVRVTFNLNVFDVRDITDAIIAGISDHF
jgi:hypothetical protein